MNDQPQDFPDAPVAHDADDAHAPEHALIRGLIAHDPSAAAHDRRMKALHAALAQDSVESTRALRFSLERWAPIALAAAALIALALFVPQRETSAREQWDALARSEGAAGSARSANGTTMVERWALTLFPPAIHEDRPPLSGTLEVLDDTHFLVTLTMPDGKVVTFARDGDTVWHSDRTDFVSFQIPRGKGFPAPVWLAQRDGTLLVGALGSMLERFDSRYAIAEVADSTQPGLRCLEAVRAVDGDQLPTAARLWVDGDDHVQRMEVEWDGPARGAAGARDPRDRRGDRAPPPPSPAMPGGAPGRMLGGALGGVPAGAPSRMVLERAGAVELAPGRFSAPANARPSMVPPPPDRSRS